MTTDAARARYDAALAIARAAGETALGFFNARDGLVIEQKSGAQDLVSQADREVELLIRARIAQAFPEDGVIGEEHDPVPSRSGYVWVVDPIDGTSPFLNGQPNWCVSIGVRGPEGLVVGVIEAPVLRETYAALAGEGATVNGRRLRVDPEAVLTSANIGFGATQKTPPAETAAFVLGLYREGGVLFRNGSGALMLAYVAAGRLAGYYDPASTPGTAMPACCWCARPAASQSISAPTTCSPAACSIPARPRWWRTCAASPRRRGRGDPRGRPGEPPSPHGFRLIASLRRLVPARLPVAPARRQASAPQRQDEPRHPRAEAVHVEVEHRRDEQGEELGHQQPAHHRDAEGLAQFGTGAVADGDRQRAHHGRRRRHHDRAEAQAAGLADRRRRAPALLALEHQGDVDHHDGVLLHDADQHQHADDRDHREVHPEELQCPERPDRRRRQAGEDGERVDEALVEDAEHEVDGDDGRRQQQAWFASASWNT